MVLCFEKPDEANGYLSNDYKCDFGMNGITFCCAEQYIQWRKAKLFNDSETAEKILATTDCDAMRILAESIKGFSENVWVQNREKIVYTAVKEKFTQDMILRAKLIETGMDQIAKCGLNDKVMGINIGIKDSARLTKAKWKGLNLLGKTLMKVRLEIK